MRVRSKSIHDLLKWNLHILDLQTCTPPPGTLGVTLKRDPIWCAKLIRLGAPNSPDLLWTPLITPGLVFLSPGYPTYPQPISAHPQPSCGFPKSFPLSPLYPLYPTLSSLYPALSQDFPNVHPVLALVLKPLPSLQDLLWGLAGILLGYCWDSVGNLG